jgi:hypothetical protein
MTPRTVDDVIRAIPHGSADVLPAPAYDRVGPFGARIGLAVESMKDHMTDEGYQLFAGLPLGYEPNGFWIRWNGLDVKQMLCDYQSPMLTTVLLQDKREWEGLTADKSRDPAMRFTNIEALRGRPDVFKVTVLKDAQHDAAYNRQAADEIDCHAWVIYYHPRIVQHLSPFVRTEHLIRTWHSLDATLVPEFSTVRKTAIISGAVSAAYPLRTRIVQQRHAITDLSYLKHPGYHRQGCETPRYLAMLGNFKVAICTSSRYGYAVRKIAEATACGCRIVTDLPTDDVMPEIDNNLYRIHPDTPMADIAYIVKHLARTWDADTQRHYADRAKAWYDYRAVGRRLAEDIEAMRRNY